MKKVSEVVLHETLYIAVTTFVFGIITQAVFLIIGMWDVTVLYGNLLGYLFGIGNFFLMALTVQKAVDCGDEKQAATMMKASQAGRMFMLFIAALAGALIPFFNLFAVIIPLLFPRIAVSLRPLFDKKKKAEDDESINSEAKDDNSEK